MQHWCEQFQRPTTVTKFINKDPLKPEYHIYLHLLLQLRAAAALQSRISQTQAHNRAAAALIHAAAASAQPTIAAATYESRSKIVSSPLPVIQASRADLAGHLFYQQQSPSHRRTPQTHLPPPSAPSSAPSSIIQLSTGKNAILVPASNNLIEIRTNKRYTIFLGQV